MTRVEHILAALSEFDTDELRVVADWLNNPQDPGCEGTQAPVGGPPGVTPGSPMTSAAWWESGKEAGRTARFPT